MSMPTETIIESGQRSTVSGQKMTGDSATEDEILAEKGFYWREKNGVKVLISRALEEKGFVNGFSTRTGGVSDFPKDSLNLAGYDEDSAKNIAENRRRFLSVFGGDFELATAWQVHGDRVKIVRDLDEARNGNDKYDALTSDLPGVLAGVKTADCVPILLGDARTKAFAAVHAGWRGTATSIVLRTIEKMRAEFGTEPKDLIAAIGPAAVCEYEIGQDVIDALGESFPDATHLFTPTRDGHAFVDLHKANSEQLLSIEVLPENISVAPLCTMERTDLFFSYRKEKKLYGKTGRLLSVVGKNK